MINNREYDIYEMLEATDYIATEQSVKCLMRLTSKLKFISNNKGNIDDKLIIIPVTNELDRALLIIKRQLPMIEDILGCADDKA